MSAFRLLRVSLHMKVRLIRKLADQLDGVNVSRTHVGDLLDLKPEDARALIAEGWATAYERRRRSPASPAFGDRRRVRSRSRDEADDDLEQAS